jgi:predicted NAD/FAD-binding protein
VRIAIVGTGVSGLVAAHRLRRAHELTLFEAGAHVGGHVHTHAVELAGRRHAIDTGFIVFNRRTYPIFCALLEELGVEAQDSDMSFSVRCERTGLEWNGRNLDTLFAQRSNLLRPSFLAMVRDILRFNREALELLEDREGRWTLGEWLAHKRYSKSFVQNYAVPMGAAIWSAGESDLQAFPARAFAAFFHNHGMLQVDGRPQWLTVKGGSRSYVEALIAPLAGRIRLRTPVRRIRRVGAGSDAGVELTLDGGEVQRFDQVVIATHSDQALRLLADPSPQEREILGAIRYQENEALLHTDASVLPRRRKCWASWNYHIVRPEEPIRPGPVAVTYWMNKLQTLDCPETVCVTLNRAHAVDPARILERITYHHPQFTRESLAAQARRDEISGVRRTWYCGAYWGYGFHEDGAKSGAAVAERLSSARQEAWAR